MGRWQGNASSHLLGRTEIVELEDKAYGWLSKNLRFIVGNLEKGRLLLRHALYGRPVFVKFPQPLYNYSTVAIEEFLSTTPAAPTRQYELDEAERPFEKLRKILKGHKGVHPIKIYSEVTRLRALGINQDTFSDWYHCWLGQQKFRGKGKTERAAFEIVLEYFSEVKAA